MKRQVRAGRGFNSLHGRSQQTDYPPQAAIHAVEDKSNSVMEWGSCNERRAVEASSQAQHAEQIADKLAVSSLSDDISICADFQDRPCRLCESLK